MIDPCCCLDKTECEDPKEAKSINEKEHISRKKRRITKRFIKNSRLNNTNHTKDSSPEDTS